MARVSAVVGGSGQRICGSGQIICGNDYSTYVCGQCIWEKGGHDIKKHYTHFLPSINCFHFMCAPFGFCFVLALCTCSSLFNHSAFA